MTFCNNNIKIFKQDWQRASKRKRIKGIKKSRHFNLLEEFKNNMHINQYINKMEFKVVVRNQYCMRC